MAITVYALSVDCADAEKLAGFWSAALGRPVATVIQPLGKFWKAEEYHQQYDEKTGRHSCPLPRHGASL